MKTQYRNRLYKQYFSNLGLVDTSLEYDINHRQYYNNYFLTRFLPEDKALTILDLGCGYGTILASLHGLGYSNLTGVDCSEEAINLWRSTNLDCKVIESGIIEFLEKSVREKLTWEVVLAFDILEHFCKDELVHILTLLKSIISPQGILVIKVPNAQSPALSGTTVFGDFTHEVALTPVSLTQVLKACGFSRIESYEASPVPYTFISYIRFFLWKIVRYFYIFLYAVETGSFDSSMIWTRSFFSIASHK
jgi:2-polyprenyl-3-methyl-5-hydroxy-6-metoxy-1,4-benzoquinol methylase